MSLDMCARGPCFFLLPSPKIAGLFFDRKRQGSEPMEATPATSMMTKIQSSETRVTSSGIHLETAARSRT